MAERLASLPRMQEKIERVQQIFPDAETLWTEDGAHCVITSECAGITYIVRLDLNFETLDADVRGTAIRSHNWHDVDLDLALKLVSEIA